ncbi:hypothetical protein ACFYNO_27175 [Kitasatospora sp. NPDC006697]|uniref:hypothetical protein n=1 Tax=Kitasatospora sp. NPDC006697 TaxID=3364020 RepID=UPI0036892811
MLSAPSRRAAALGAATIAALLTGGATALPAQATGTTVTVSATPVLALPADGSSTDLDAFVGETANGSITQITITADLSSLAGVAVYGTPQTGCSVQGSQLTCTEQATPNGASLRTIPFKAAPGAALGASAPLHLTATDATGSSLAFDSTLVVGGSKLQVTGSDQQAKPGSTVQEAFSISNNGSLATQRTVVALSPSVGLQFNQRYSNCEYGTTNDLSGRNAVAPQVAVCTIDSGIEPGATAHLDPVGLTTAASALSEFVGVNVFPSRDSLDLQNLLKHYTGLTPGSGPRLTLGKPEGTPAGTPVADLARTGNTQVDVNVDNTADFVALGSWTPAGDGTTGTLTVGLRNDGPAAAWLHGEFIDVQVVLPDGVKVAASGDGCLDQKISDAGRSVYECEADGWQPVGAQQTYNLKLTIDDPSKVRDAQVFFHNPNQPATLTSAYDPSFDPNQANDRLTVALGAKPASATPTPSTAPSAAPSTAAPAAATSPVATASAPREDSTKAADAADGNSGKALAFTGGGSSAGPIAAIGGGVLLLGAGAVFWASRKRRSAEQG